MIRSFAWSFLEQGGSKVVQLLVQIALARLISPEAFGMLAILLVLTNVGDAIAQSGLGMALVQKNDAKSKDYTTAFWLSLLIAIGVLILLWIASPFVALLYCEPDLELLLRILSLVVVFNSVNSVQRAYLQRNMNFKGLFYANFTAALLSGVTGVVAACLGAGIWALIVQALTQSLFACAVLLAVVPWKPSLEFDRASAREMFSYGWKICVTGILNVVYVGVSELIIGRTCSVADLGFYSQGRKWPNAVIAIVTNSLQNVFFPAFSAVKNNLEVLRMEMRKSLVAGSFLLVPFSFFCTVAAEPIIVLLLTDAWLPCVPVFQAICLSNSLTLLQVVNLRAYMALGDSGLYMRLQIVKVVLSIFCIGGAAVLTRDIYIVSAVTAILGAFNILVVDLQPAKSMHGYSRVSQIVDVLPIIAVSLISALFAFAISLLCLPTVGELLLEALVFSVSYFVLAKAFKVYGATECIYALKGIVKRIR